MTKNYLITIFVLGCFLLFWACKNSTKNDVPPPARVQFIQVPDSIDDLSDLRPIGPVPESKGIQLIWEPNTEKQLAGYAIYRSTEPRVNYSPLTRVVTEYGVADTSYLDISVDLDVRYYYYIRAFDELDQFGEPSDTLSYKLLEKPDLISPNSLVKTNEPTFSWHYDGKYNEFVFRLAIKINEVNNLQIFANELSFDVDYGSVQKWNFDKLGLETPLETRMYRWRIDPVGSEEFTGAASDWMEFTVE